MAQLLTIPHIQDCALTEEDALWAQAPWQRLEAVSGAARYETKFRCASSDKGLYVQFYCQDDCLSSSGLQDFQNLYEEDVVELFLQPKAGLPLYFEYELSPLNAELPLLVCNNGDYYGWLPFQYEAGRKTRHSAGVVGGNAAPGAHCDSWHCEVFLPYALLEGLTEPPRKGDRWQANFYRIDYDGRVPTHWAWNTQTGHEFHDYSHFGTIEFA